ncbi:MAG TPA: zinc ribbon domain-containing protein [Solirubrobacterales bacterium]|nr:zinc ribbon domain-containing protein [Solirubrobacterales bacterium]
MAAPQQPSTTPAEPGTTPDGSASADGAANADPSPTPPTQAQPTQAQPQAAQPLAGQPQPQAAAGGPACPNCGAPMAADQRYCLNCGNRRGAPRVGPNATPPAAQGAAPATAESAKAQRQSDVSPLAAVIGIALLGGMLLIGVLIGRGTGEDPPAPVVRVGEASTTPSDSSAGSGSGGAVASEWPAGTDGFTVQISTVVKDGATAETVDAAKQQAVEDGATDAAVLDSDRFSSLPPGNYVIYSGVYTDRRSAETALEGLSSDFPTAAVVEVTGEADTSSSSSASGTDGASANQATDESGGVLEEIVPEVGGESEAPTGGATPEAGN